jgi:hypothetical protein
MAAPVVQLVRELKIDAKSLLDPKDGATGGQ